MKVFKNIAFAVMTTSLFLFASCIISSDDDNDDIVNPFAGHTYICEKYENTYTVALKEDECTLTIDTGGIFDMSGVYSYKVTSNTSETTGSLVLYYGDASEWTYEITNGSNTVNLTHNGETFTFTKQS